MANVLYVGPLNYGGTCLQRFNALKALGYNLKGINTLPNLSLFLKKLEKLNSYLNYKLDLIDINDAIIKSLKGENFDLIWIDKGNRIFKETLISVKKINKSVLLVDYNPDDPFGKYKKGWDNFIQSIPYYDIHLVPRKENIAEYKSMGAKNVLQFIPFWGYSPEMHSPIEIDEKIKNKFGGKVGFIGDFENERASALFFLAKSGINVRVWGPNWKNAKMKHQNLLIENRGLWKDDYKKAICSFDINLCFLRKGNRDSHTSRSIEIPACGGFMLAERTTEHLTLFEEGKEAEFFETDEELLGKIKYYLSHQQERKRIAIAGYNRCLKSEYSNSARLKIMLKKIMES